MSQQEGIQSQQVEPSQKSASGNGSQPAGKIEVSSGDADGSSTAKPVEVEGIAQRSISGATGPRTPEGKQISRYNATKHGVFSEVTLLKGESRTEYQSLLKGLWEAFQPEGKLEETLVEKLATILWRHRRLIVAESAEIQRNTEFLQWDQSNQEQEEAEQIESSSVLEYSGGLIRKIQNPAVLKRCLELLAGLRQRIDSDGFDPERDTVILKRIYGGYGKDRLRETLYGSYMICLETSRASEEEPQREGYASPQECVRRAVQEMDREIRRLKRYRKIEVNRTKLETLRRSIPESPSLDRLLRYEASLERAFERTLNQLERLQRMRLGQPVLPPVKLELST